MLSRDPTVEGKTHMAVVVRRVSLTSLVYLGLG